MNDFLRQPCWKTLAMILSNGKNTPTQNVNDSSLRYRKMRLITFKNRWTSWFCLFWIYRSTLSEILFTL